MNDFYEEFLKALEDAIKRAGNAHRLSIVSGVPNNSITPWRKRQRIPSLDAVCPLLPYLELPSTMSKKMMNTDLSKLADCTKERDAL